MSAPPTHKSTWIKALAEEGEEDVILSTGLGMSAKGDPLNTGGVLPDIRRWNADCECIGRVQLQTLATVKHGGERGTLVPIKTTQQPVWTLFSANDDGVCLAYPTMCFPDNSTYM
ncbi:hypothetical protein DL768_011671 [Monosporascus sp. mg162]|nr:hypothetical protein DL768_011671 [Monosporascus sp. mg162]